MDLHIKDVLQQFIQKDKQIGDKYYAQRIRAYWQDHMTQTITSRTREILYADGKLQIIVDSAPLRHELWSMRDTIKERINGYLEKDIIRLIELK